MFLASPEVRIPKSEIRRKSESRNPKNDCCYRIRPSDFGLPSAFGFRISDFFLRTLLLAFMSADLLSGFSAPATAPRQFRAGAATSNITPRLGISINGYF